MTLDIVWRTAAVCIAIVALGVFLGWCWATLTRWRDRRAWWRNENAARRERELSDADLWLGRGPSAKDLYRGQAMRSDATIGQDQHTAERRARLRGVDRPDARPREPQSPCPQCGGLNDQHDVACAYARHQPADSRSRLRGDLDRQRRGGRGGA